MSDWRSNRGSQTGGKAVKGTKKASRRKATCRAYHRCSLCGIGGLVENEFAGGQSKWAYHDHVVFAKGTIDEPAGDCLKCDTVFYAAGYSDEFETKEKFVKQRDDDIALAGSFTKACALWLAAKNEGRRCRARSDGKRARKDNNLLSELQESRLGRLSLIHI